MVTPFEVEPFQPGLSNGYAVVPSPDHHIKHSYRRSIFIHPNDMAEPAEPLVINTLSNVHVIEEFIQLPIGSDTVVSLPTLTEPQILRSTFLWNTPKVAESVLDSVHASAP